MSAHRNQPCDVCDGACEVFCEVAGRVIVCTSCLGMGFHRVALEGGDPATITPLLLEHGMRVWGDEDDTEPAA